MVVVSSSTSTIHIQVVSDEGIMLTQVKLDLFPGDKRLLGLTLPKNATFWFAFVNQNGAWPWRDQDRLLVPLEQQAKRDELVPVEIFYAAKIGPAGFNSLDLKMLAPKFDLPLENITWNVSLNDRWKLARWSGSLQLEEQSAGSQVQVQNLESYLQTEKVAKQERSSKAESFLAFGNNALQQGDQREARRAFQNALGLSTHDAAFNEDARVQLHNVKIQQAIVGLNLRQAAVAVEALNGSPSEADVAFYQGKSVPAPVLWKFG